MAKVKDSQHYIDGMAAQHKAIKELEQKYGGFGTTFIESPEGSARDMVDKVDLTVINVLLGTREFDIKSTESKNEITYTYKNKLGQFSKIYKQEFNVDLIFVFPDESDKYLVSAKNFYIALLMKIAKGEDHAGMEFEKNSKGKWVPKIDPITKQPVYNESRYVKFTKDEIKAISVII